MTAIKQYPMVLGTSTTEGQVSLFVDGTVVPFLGWSTITEGDAVRYVITDGAQFEEGRGAVSSGPTLARTTILRTSNGDTTKIDWGTGTRQVYVVPDIDIVMQYDDGEFAQVVPLEIKSSDGSKRYRWKVTSQKMQLVMTDTDPDVVILDYDGTQVEASRFVDFPEKVKLPTGSQFNGADLTEVATWTKPSEAEAIAGLNDARVMTPFRIPQALTGYQNVFATQTSESSPALTDLVVTGRPTGTLVRTSTFASLKTLFNAPDFEETGITVESGVKSYSHGLGAEPQRVEAQLRCTATDIGFAVGDVLPLYSTDTTSAGWQATSGKNATIVWYVLGSGWGTFRRDTGALSAIDYSKWSGEIRAWL